MSANSAEKIERIFAPLSAAARNARKPPRLVRQALLFSRKHSGKLMAAGLGVLALGAIVGNYQHGIPGHRNRSKYEK
jgi:hypothetical protein